jgi:hypothetical protein
MIRVRNVEDQVVPVLVELKQGLRTTSRLIKEEDTRCMEVQVTMQLEEQEQLFLRVNDL